MSLDKKPANEVVGRLVVTKEGKRLGMVKDITFEKYDIGRLAEDIDDLVAMTLETEGKVMSELGRAELNGYERAIKTGADSPYVFIARDSEGKPVGYVFGTAVGATISTLPFTMRGAPVIV